MNTERIQYNFENYFIYEYQFYGLDAIIFCHALLVESWHDGGAFNCVFLIYRFDVGEGLITLHEKRNDHKF